MPARLFKSDESFLEKLAIGATGTRKVIENLKNHGHIPIELERGSTGYKIWKTIKIKRVRVPDILSVSTGIRIESRAKTNLIISMSHSTAEESRGWDYGLKDDDYTAFVVCERVGEEPIAWQAIDLVQYIRVKDLREAFDSGNVIIEKPKGAEEGFETRVTWPAAVANNYGTVFSISDEKLQYKRANDNRKISVKLSRKGIPLTPIVGIGAYVVKFKILATNLNVIDRIPIEKEVDEKYYTELLASSSISDRYSAAKALSHVPGTESDLDLVNRLKDESEHIYVRLEVAATLARKNNPVGIEFIQKILSNSYLEHRLEAVIILGEIKLPAACDILKGVLNDARQNQEIRAGAAWALGELNNKESVPDLIKAFLEVQPSIQVEAARALAKLCDQHAPEVLSYFPNVSEVERPGVAWALSRSDKWSLDDILKHTPQENLDARQWATYILGSNDESRIISDIEKLKAFDSEMYFAVTLLWKVISSWAFNLKEY